MKEKIVKLLKSKNKEDFTVAMHLLGHFEFEEIISIIRTAFPKTRADLDHEIFFGGFATEIYTQFYYGDKFIHISNRMGSINRIYNFSTYKTVIICEKK